MVTLPNSASDESRKDNRAIWSLKTRREQQTWLRTKHRSYSSDVPKGNRFITNSFRFPPAGGKHEKKIPGSMPSLRRQIASNGQNARSTSTNHTQNAHNRDHRLTVLVEAAALLHIHAKSAFRSSHGFSKKICLATDRNGGSRKALAFQPFCAGEVDSCWIR